MPRMNERDRRAAIDAQITALLDQAVDPGLNDSTGIANILRAQLVAEMMAKHERVKAAWDSALAKLIAVLEQRIQDLQAKKPYTIFGINTVGCYGRDAQGNPWATFQIINGSTTCHVCGATIDRGWMRGRIGEEQIHVCSEHINVTWEKKQRK